jgi:tetratricopeptide (TPR) repeat protein
MRTVVIPPPPAPEPEPAPTMAAAAEAAPEGAGGDPAEVLGRCRALAQDRRFGEVVEEATAVLNQPGRADRGTAAQLWREVALARAAMGDQEAALTAFRNAVDTAPEAGRGAMREAFAEWAAAAAQAGVAAAEEGARFDALRTAKTLLEEAVAAAGPHAAIARVATSIEPEYWPAYESHVQTLIAERDFGEAYRLATEALADTDLPAGRRGVFEDFRAETMSARITALIERAVIGMDEHREWEAVGALERAETLFRSATTLSAERRAETARQLAEAYGRLGRRRVDAGEFDDAVDPLFRALRIGPPDSDKRDDARWALVQALQGVVDARVAMIREVAAAGSRDSAVVQADKLWALLRSGMAAGVPQESMTNAVAATRKLIEDLGGTA